MCRAKRLRLVPLSEADAGYWEADAAAGDANPGKRSRPPKPSPLRGDSGLGDDSLAAPTRRISFLPTPANAPSSSSSSSQRKKTGADGKPSAVALVHKDGPAPAPSDPTGHTPAAAPPHHMGSGEPAPSAALIVPRSLLEEINEDVEAGYLAEAKEPPPPRPQSRERPHSRGPAAKAAARAARKSRAPPPAATPPPSPPGVYASGGGGGGGEDDGGSSEWRQPRRTPQVDEYTKMQALEMQRRAQRQMEAELKKRGQKRGGTLASLKKGYFELAVALRLRPAPKAATLAAVMVEAKLQGKRKALRWRSPRVYLLRMAAAWAFNLLVLLICLLLALAYAIRLVPIQANNMLLVWLVSYGWTFAFLEPVKILLLAGIPGLWNEKTRLGRTLLRCRFLYNELCAP